MPRQSQFPDTVDDCLIISMKDLKELGFLIFRYRGSISWKRGEKVLASVWVEIQMDTQPFFMKLKYSFTKRNQKESEKMEYQIPIESIPSNLGKGHRYYFRCPETDKRCTKLYKPPGESIFAHREHWEGLFYSSQIQSKQWRKVNRFFDQYKKNNDTSTKYMKTHYRGKITPRYKAYLFTLKKYEFYGFEALEVLKG